jgi:ParB-like chromosome segregation protein Spo0J
MTSTDPADKHAPLQPLRGPTARPVVEDVPIKAIILTAKNPRSSIEPESLGGLQASLGDKRAPFLVQFPVVERRPDGTYGLVIGARRITAADLENHETVRCLVYSEPLDPLLAHHMRLVENMHRQPVTPFDEALALRVAYAAANGQALGFGREMRDELEVDRPLVETLAALEKVLDDSGQFAANKPPVKWEAVLNQLGVTMRPDERRRLLRTLNVETKLHTAVRGLNLTEAAVRSIGTLASDQQAELVAALQAEPGLARRVRRICDVVKSGEYSLEDALEEARMGISKSATRPTYGFGGATSGQDKSEAPDTAEAEDGEDGVPARSPRAKQFEGAEPPAQAAPEAPPAPGIDAEAVETAAVRVTGAVAELVDALTALRNLAGVDLAALPATWKTDVLAALALVRAELP